MDKPMSEYAADAPRVLRDFLTYISTIQGKSAKTAHEYYLDLRCFSGWSSTIKDLWPEICRLRKYRSMISTLLF